MKTCPNKYRRKLRAIDILLQHWMSSGAGNDLLIRCETE